MGESKTMKRIRVLHSELNGELGGIESFLYNVYRFIDKEKVEFDFLTISDTPAYGDKFKKMGSTVYKVPKHINFLGYYFAIDKILREGNYDIVHIHKNSAIDILILKVLQRFPNIRSLCTPIIHSQAWEVNLKSYTSLIENTYMIMLTIVWHVRTMQENGCTGMELLK